MKPDTQLTSKSCFVCFRLEGLMELYSQGYERSYTVNSSILNAIEPHLKDFQQLLLDPPKVKHRVC